MSYYLNSNIKEIDINNKLEERHNKFLLHENKNHEAKDNVEQISLKEEVKKPSKNSINGKINYYTIEIIKITQYFLLIEESFNTNTE